MLEIINKPETNPIDVRLFNVELIIALEIMLLSGAVSTALPHLRSLAMSFEYYGNSLDNDYCND